jgi:hypothetical protein
LLIKLAGKLQFDDLNESNSTIEVELYYRERILKLENYEINY